MGKGRRQMFESSWPQKAHNLKDQEDQWVLMEGENYDDKPTASSSSSTTSSIGSDSSISNGSSSSAFDIADDASSFSTSCSTSARSNNSVYDLSKLMSQLPIKRGLSKYYQGKSESFTSLSKVTSIEDLAKKETPYRRKMKACKSYGCGLDTYKSYTLPKPIILKKVTRSLFSSSSFLARKGSFPSSCKPPLVPIQRKLEC